MPVRRVAVLIALSLFLIQFALFLFLSHYPYRVAPDDRTYIDIGYGFYYLNVIRQGMDGDWGVLDPTSTLSVPRVYIYLFFSFLGHLANWFSIDPVMMYQTARVVGTIFLFVSTFLFIRMLVPPGVQALAVLLVFGFEIGPHIITPGTPAFTGQTLIARHFGLTHHVWGVALSILTLFQLVRTVINPTIPRMIILFIVTAAATEILPSAIVTVAVAASPIIVIWAYVHKKLKHTLVALCVMAIAMGLAGGRVSHELSRTLPYSNMTATEKTWTNNIDLLLAYTSSLILYVPFLLLLAVAALRKYPTWSSKHKLTLQLCTSWVAIPYLLVPLSHLPFFPIANFRLIEGYHYLPLGILAAIGIHEFLSLFSHRKLKKIILVSMILAIIAVSTLQTYRYTKLRMTELSTTWSNTHPLKSTWDAVTYMKHLPKGAGVMSREYMGEILPGYGNIRVFIDGPMGHPDWRTRQYLSQRFFSGTLATEEAGKILRDYHVSHVFFGPDEQYIASAPPFYPELLAPVYITDSVILFSIRP